MSQKISVVRNNAGSDFVTLDSFTPFDTGVRLLELGNFQTHVQPDGYRDIGESLRIVGIKVQIGDTLKTIDFKTIDLYQFVVDPTSNNQVFKVEGLLGSRMAITNDGCYPFHYQLDAVYNKDNGKLMVMGIVVNNKTDKSITIDKVILSYKE